MDTVWSLEDLPEPMDDRDKWRERDSGKSEQAAQPDDDYININIKEVIIY